MGILGRLSSLVKSNVNDVIDSMQDPAKGIDQMVRDMEESARQARTGGGLGCPLVGDLLLVAEVPANRRLSSTASPAPALPPMLR